jgi:hypothetical protein
MKTVNETIDNKMNIGVRSLLRVLVKSQVNDQVEARIASQVWTQIREQVCFQVWTQIKENIEL